MTEGRTASQICYKFFFHFTECQHNIASGSKLLIDAGATWLASDQQLDIIYWTCDVKQLLDSSSLHNNPVSTYYHYPYFTDKETEAQSLHNLYHPGGYFFKPCDSWCQSQTFRTLVYKKPWLKWKFWLQLLVPFPAVFASFFLICHQCNCSSLDKCSYLRCSPSSFLIHLSSSQVGSIHSQVMVWIWGGRVGRVGYTLVGSHWEAPGTVLHSSVTSTQLSAFS